MSEVWETVWVLYDSMNEEVAGVFSALDLAERAARRHPQAETYLDISPFRVNRFTQHNRGQGGRGMSTWGRAQDALDGLLFGFEISQAGERAPGLLDKYELPYEEQSQLVERILETLSYVRYHSGEPAFLESPHD